MKESVAEALADEARASLPEWVAAVADAAPEALVIADGEGRLVLVNPVAEKLFGYRALEVLGHLVEILIPERERVVHREHRREYLAHPRARPMGLGLPLYGRRKDGAEIPVDISLRPVETDDGQLVLAAIQELSGRERDRAEALAYLTSVEGAIDDAIFRVDAGGVIRTWNRSAERIYGWKSDEIVGRHAEILLPDHIRETEAPLLDHVLGGERVERFETERRRKDGMMVPVSLTISPVRDNEGTVLGAVAVTRELTEQRLAQMTLAESEARLEEAQSLAHVGLWLWDSETDTLQISDELHHVLGIEPLEFEGTIAGYVSRVEPERRQELTALFERARRGSRSFEHQHRVVRPNGEQRWVYMRGEPAFDSAGTSVGFRGICQDITDTKRAEQALQRHASLMELLRRLAVAANEAPTLDDALQICLREVSERLEWPLAVVYRVDDGQLVGPGISRIANRRRFGRFARAVEAGEEIPDAGAAARVVSGCEPVWVEELLADPASDEAIQATAFRVRSVIAFPVRVGKEVVAVVEFFSPEHTERDQPVLDVLTDAGTQLGRVVERTRAAEALAHQALHDPLTGLPNRTLFVDRLGHALERAGRAGTPVAVLFLDLDGFKVINDSLGHEAGDQLLLKIGERLAVAIRGSDTIARFGGDEFTILCEELRDEGEALEVAERVSAAIAEPLRIGAAETVVTASIGIAFAKDTNDRPEVLLRDADAAMYRAKEEGRARYEIFDSAMHTRATYRLETVNALRQAIEREEFRLVYQPNVTLPDHRIVGVEALIRWQRGDRLLGPGEFIELAEESHLIVPMGSWALREACRQAGEWFERTGVRLKMSVNVSARQLNHPDLVDIVAAAIDETGTDASTVSLELTESAIMSDVDFALHAMLGLRAAGVQLAIDDFGTGYSSLAYLRRFPVQILKIDKSFVDGLDDDKYARAIAGAVVELAHAVDMTTVAEGVEEESQLAVLESLGCDQAQGFYFARPLPPDDIAALLVPGTRLPVAVQRAVVPGTRA